MADKTGIEWTDATWNPVTGCTEVSPGCDHCYAKTFAERWRGTRGHYFEHGFDVQLRPDKLDLPLRWKRPRRIFVNSMSDLFHDDVPDDFIAKVFAIAVLAPQHTFQVLTKRHGRMRSLLHADYFRMEVRSHAAWWADHLNVELPRPFWPLPNVWLGVSAENQQWADIRIPALLDTPAAVRFVSAEPLLGPIALKPEWLAPQIGCALWTQEPTDQDIAALNEIARAAVRHVGGGGFIDWVIVGGESGHGARPMNPEWPRAIKNQCVAAGIPFLFKQWGEYIAGYRSRGGVLIDPWGSRDPDVWVGRNTGLVRPYSSTDGSADTWWSSMYRVGKKAAGRELDWQTWDQYPVVANA